MLGCKFLAAIVLAACAIAQQRPPITGIAHVALKSDNLDAARQFYVHDLGFAESFQLNNPDGTSELTFFKINDH